MPDQSRVPRTIPEFANYIVQSSARLIAINAATANPYWTDFNFTAGENTAWAAKLTLWTPLFAAYSNPETSTSIVKQDVKDFISDFAVFAQPLLNKIVASGLASNTDASIFHVDLRRAEPSVHTGKILLDVRPSIKQLGRGMMDVHCSYTEDQSRASIPVEEGANSVQYAYTLSNDAIAPVPPDQPGVEKGLSTKAHFQIDLGPSTQGKWINIYFRWYNTKHPDLAGPWSIGQPVVVG